MARRDRGGGPGQTALMRQFEFEDADVRYISTRGEAPALGFIDVTLAGLAPDGGLYVPETWPAVDPAAVADYAGRPYADVACDVISRFASGGTPDLARMT